MTPEETLEQLEGLQRDAERLHDDLAELRGAADLPSLDHAVALADELKDALDDAAEAADAPLQQAKAEDHKLAEWQRWATA
jgi:hypothetical protein